jgi:hypothetical protein
MATDVILALQRKTMHLRSNCGQICQKNNAKPVPAHIHYADTANMAVTGLNQGMTEDCN